MANKPPRQQDLFSNLSPSPKARRQERMGSGEEPHWGQLPAGFGGPWDPGPEGDVWAKGEDQGIRPPVLVGIDEAGRGPLAGPVSVAAVVFSPDQLFGLDRRSWVGALDDSKRMTERAREELFDTLVAEAPAWAIAHVHADHVDKVNILQATFHGMALCAASVLGLCPEVVDWPDKPACRARVWNPTGDDDDGDELEARAWYAGTICPGPQGPVGVDVLYHRATEVVPGDRTRLLVDGHKPFKVPFMELARCRQFPLVKGDGLSFHIAAASVLAKVSRDTIMGLSAVAWPGYGFAGHKGYPTKAHKDALHKAGPCPIHRKTFRY